MFYFLELLDRWLKIGSLKNKEDTKQDKTHGATNTSGVKDKS
jgi:hypothetical protein